MVRKTFEREYKETIELHWDGYYFKVIKSVYYKGDLIEQILIHIAENFMDKEVRRGNFRYFRDKHNQKFMEKYKKELRQKLLEILKTLMQENIKEEIRYKYLEHIIKGTISEGWINSTYKSLVVLQNHRKGQNQFRKPKNIKV